MNRRIWRIFLLALVTFFVTHCPPATVQFRVKSPLKLSDGRVIAWSTTDTEGKVNEKPILQNLYLYVLDAQENTSPSESFLQKDFQSARMFYKGLTTNCYALNNLALTELMLGENPMKTMEKALNLCPNEKIIQQNYRTLLAL